jgi:hypothetical protein
MTVGKLGIPAVFDVVSQTYVEAALVLPKLDVDVSLLRDRVRKERRNRATRFGCGLCRDPVYVSNSGGTSHFAHYKDSCPSCAWRAETPLDLDAISAARFGGRQEGELHRRLLLTLQQLCRNAEGFRDVGIPNDTLFGIEGTGHRFPDLAVVHRGRRVVFELQISKTYLPVISDRESFYRRNGIYLIWLFHDFDIWRGRQTERDIVALRGRQAFELSADAIVATLKSGRLMLRAHWQVPQLSEGALSWEWMTKLVAIDDLEFDPYLMAALAARPWDEEADLLRDVHADVIRRFEDFWRNRTDWSRRLSQRVEAEYRNTRHVDSGKTYNAVLTRAFEAIFAAAGTDPGLVDRAFELNFPDLLDRLLFVRDGVNHFNGQDLAGALDSVFEHWPHFTETLCAVAAAYGHRRLLEREGARRKLLRNLSPGESAAAQCREFDRVAALLCPKAAASLRSSYLIA